MVVENESIAACAHNKDHMKQTKTTWLISKYNEIGGHVCTVIFLKKFSFPENLRYFPRVCRVWVQILTSPLKSLIYLAIHLANLHWCPSQLIWVVYLDSPGQVRLPRCSLTSNTSDLKKLSRMILISNTFNSQKYIYTKQIRIKFAKIQSI